MVELKNLKASDLGLSAQVSPLELSARIKGALASADARTLDILDGIGDNTARAKYLLADSEAKRMQVHRDYWQAKFEGAAEAARITGFMPAAVLAVACFHPQFDCSAMDLLATGAVTAVMQGGASAISLLKEKAADFMAGRKEKAAAVYAEPAHATEIPVHVNLVAQSSSSGLFAEFGKRMKDAGPEEQAVYKAMGFVVSTKLSQSSGQQVSEVVVSQRMKNLGDRLSAFAEKDPLGAKRAAAAIGEAMAAYGVDVSELGLATPKRGGATLGV